MDVSIPTALASSPEMGVSNVGTAVSAPKALVSDLETAACGSAVPDLVTAVSNLVAVQYRSKTAASRLETNGRRTPDEHFGTHKCDFGSRKRFYCSSTSPIL